jgi:hypothetical protein
MRDDSAYELERLAAARLRLALDSRLGRHTPESVFRLGVQHSDFLDESVSSAQLTIPPPRAEDLAPRSSRILTAILPIAPLFIVIVLSAWWRVEAVPPLLAGAGAAVVAGALPIYLLGRLIMTGFWSTAWPTVLTAVWLALVPGIFGLASFAPALSGAVFATVAIGGLGRLQNDIQIPRLGTRDVGAALVDLQPLLRYGLAAAGYGAGTVLSAVLDGTVTTAPDGLPLAVTVLTVGLTALAYALSAVGIQLAIALTARLSPRFGFAALLTTVVLLTLWHLAIVGGTGWRLAGCVVVVAAASGLAFLIRQRASAGQMSR